MLKRLDQILSNCGYCSRTEAKKIARQGRLRSGETVIKDASCKVDPMSVYLDDEPLDHPEGVLVMLNKPAGYVCSHDSSEGERIYDLLPELWQDRNPAVSSIGRLDKDATGLILITDQTRLIHDLTSPRHHVEKTYRVSVDTPLTKDLVLLFAGGTIVLDGEEKPCLPATLKLLDDTTADLSVTEGKYHHVKRMFASAGYNVVALHRWKFGEYTLIGLKEGKWKDLPLPGRTDQDR